MKAIGYRRVSTREQGDSGLGLEAQERALKAAIAAKGWEHAADFHDVHTGKTTNGRKGLHQAIEALEGGEADVLVVSRLDRLSRSTKDFADLLDRARENGWKLKMLDPDVDTSTATGELIAGILCQVVQWEARIIGEGTKDALAAARARGVRLGGRRCIPDSVRERIFAMRDSGSTLQAICDALEADQVPTGKGGVRWYPSTVRAVLKTLQAARSGAGTSRASAPG